MAVKREREWGKKAEPALNVGRFLNPGFAPVKVGIYGARNARRNAKNECSGH